MKLVLCFIGGLVLVNIVAATFVWPPSDKASVPPAPIVNAATRHGQDPWMANERYLADSRANIRKGMLATLGKPWSTWCTADGHRHLIEAIDNYYYQRHAEAWSKANAYGEEAKRFAIKAWTTTDDNRIERLVSETHDRGYFSLDELQPYARTPLSALVQGAHVHARPCAT
jgi:hypothetical protein